MDRSRARKHFPGVQCATGNVVFHSSSDGNPISINNQGVAALYHEHIFIKFVNMGGRGSGLGACPKRHLTAVRAVEHVTLNALSCLIRLCDPVERMFHEFRKVAHGCNPTHLNRPTQSPAVTGASAGFTNRTFVPKNSPAVGRKDRWDLELGGVCRVDGCGRTGPNRMAHSSRFATPIASIIIRCISSAPTEVFKTIASCMGRNVLCFKNSKMCCFVRLCNTSLFDPIQPMSNLLDLVGLSQPVKSIL